MAMTIGEFEDPHEAARQLTEARPVDLVHLARYTLGDRAMEREVLGLYAGQYSQDIARLRAATSLEDWRRAAHTIKGSARGIGAWKLARVAEEVEQMTEADRINAGAEALARVERAGSAVKLFIANMNASG